MKTFYLFFIETKIFRIVQPLGISDESALKLIIFSFRVYLVVLIILAYYSRNKSYKSSILMNLFNHTQVSHIGTLLNPNPRILSQGVVLCLITLVNPWHFFQRNQNYLSLQNARETLDGLPHIDFFESFYIDIAFHIIRGCYRENLEWISSSCIVNCLIH